MMISTFLIPLAMAAPPAGADGAVSSAAGGQQSGIFMFVWIGLMILLFYFMLIRPQKRREKERKALMEALKSGDRVIFSGGILGVVTNVKEKTVVVRVADGCKVEILRGAVAQVVGRGEALSEPEKG